MIIQAKATQSGPNGNDPAQRYVLKSMDRKSKAPFAVGLMLTGLFVYLKSMFPSFARRDETTEPLSDEETNAAAAEEPLLAIQQSMPELDPEPVGTTPTPGGFGAGSGRGLVDLMPPAEFMLIESPEVSLAFEQSYVGWQEFGKIDGSVWAANDNIGGGGSGGIGGGGDDDDAVDPVDPGDGDDGVDCEGGSPGNCNNVCDDDEDDDETNCNRAPRVSGSVKLMDISGCAILAIGLAELLHNASDPDGDSLSVRNLTTSSGTLTQSADGWVFQGGSQFEGLVTITYEITDGELSVSQTAYFSVLRSVYEGTGADDLILGSMCADEIDGRDGDDNIDARAGNDVVAGGAGDDHIVAGAGDDVVLAGSGDDIVFAGAGNDHISGGDGNDRLYGEDGDDVVFGDAGDDQISGGKGSDILNGGIGDDAIYGDAGDDVLIGGAGNDRLSGGEGNDHLSGGDGRDVLTGGSGNDVLVDSAGEDENSGGSGDDHVIAAADQADDRHDGGEGADTLDYSQASESIAVDLAEGVATGEDIGTDAITSFETVVGGSGGDELTGSDGDDTLLGASGDDTIEGGQGDDTLAGDAGNDRLSGGCGDDVLIDGAGEDENLGGAGDDHVVVAADQADDRHDGGDGYDTLDFSQTSEGVAVDLVEGWASGEEIGTDSVASFEAVVGGAGDDHFKVGDASGTVLTGGAGDDAFEFGPAPEYQPTTYKILDFSVGDRIRISKYDMFEKVMDKLEDKFEKIYGVDIDDDDVQIRYRHDRSEELNQTIIEADFNGDDVWETTIAINGHRGLVIIEQA